MTATLHPAPWPLEDRATVRIAGRELCTAPVEVAARLARRINGDEPDPVTLGDDSPSGYVDGRPFDLTADALEALARIVDEAATARIASLPPEHRGVVTHYRIDRRDGWPIATHIDGEPIED